MGFVDKIRYIWRDLMDKTVKVKPEIHTLLSIKAARLKVKKSDLAAAMIKKGLESPDEIIIRQVEKFKTEYPNPALLQIFETP